jgi:hypothetical protein
MLGNGSRRRRLTDDVSGVLTVALPVRWTLAINGKEARAQAEPCACNRPQRAVGRDDREVVPSFVPMRGRPRRRVSLLLSESRVCRTRGRQLSASGRGGASATRHTPAGGRSRERLRSSRRRAPTSAAPGNRDVVAGQLADVDLTWADALLLRVLDHLKPLGEPSGASG